jgi:predicted flap endonuclease-1-like 5' DNA nuclease
VWFLTIESIALLVVATTLGLFAGWLVWGGKPAVLAAKVAESSAAQSSVATLAEADERSQGEFGELDADWVVDSVEATRSDTLKARVADRQETVGTRLSAEEIDPEAFGSSALGSTSLATEGSEAGQTPELDYRAFVAAQSRQPESDQLESGGTRSEAEMGPASITESLELVASQLRGEVDQLSAQLETREADVVRLKAKLRKAVEEIEKRTALAQAARAELAEHQRMVQSLASAQANPTVRSDVSANAVLPSASRDDDDFAPAGTRFTPAEIDELVQARTASLLIQTSQLERRTALIQSRAEEAEARVVALKAEAAQHQSEHDEVLAKAEREAADRILALEVDLASARQRTTMATQELMGFGSEISAIRDTNAKHLQSVHETMRDLQHRLDTAKAALAGRSIPAPKPSSLMAEHPSSSSVLMALPGMSSMLVDSLAELGISTLEDVASWTDEDVDHIQSLLPEDPEIVERNGWVAAAQRSLSSRSSLSSSSTATEF